MVGQRHRPCLGEFLMVVTGITGVTEGTTQVFDLIPVSVGGILVVMEASVRLTQSRPFALFLVLLHFLHHYLLLLLPFLLFLLLLYLQFLRRRIE